ncbi:MAG: type II toxin-antitoxin system VapB family antitoxin [Microthrixaceae bacterium]
MALSIKSELADRLARELASLTGESITDAVVRSLEDRLRMERRRQSPDVRDLLTRFAQLPVLDDRPADAILGYNEDGLPT